MRAAKSFVIGLALVKRGATIDFASDGSGTSMRVGEDLGATPR